MYKTPTQEWTWFNADPWYLHLFCLSINTDLCIKKVDKDATEHGNDGANQIMHLALL
jgi:hypothetical protein